MTPAEEASAAQAERTGRGRKVMLVVLIGGVLVAALFGMLAIRIGLAMIPQSTYNKWNPFIPKPSPGDFPAQLGRFRQTAEPEYLKYDFVAKLGEYYYASYAAPGAPDLRLTVWSYKTADEARQGFDARKKEVAGYKDYQLVDEKADRFAGVWTKNGGATVVWLDGTKLKEIRSPPQAIAYEFEGLLRNTAPAAVVDVKPAPSPSPAASSNAVGLAQLFDDYKKSEAEADKKYKNRRIAVEGVVVVADKDKNGNPLVAFMKPGELDPTKGMLVCGFDKLEQPIVSTIKKGDRVALEGKVYGNLLGNIMLENCTKK